MKAEVIWKSKETTPNGDPFLTVKKARGYFYYAERGGVDSVAFILYDKATGLFGLIRESKPPLDESAGFPVSMLTAAGGSIDSDMPYKTIVRAEVLEEMGILVSTKDIICTGNVLVSTQMNQRCWTYIVKVDNPTIGPSEEDNELVWCSEDTIMSLFDWKAINIIAQARYNGVIR